MTLADLDTNSRLTDSINGAMLGNVATNASGVINGGGVTVTINAYLYHTNCMIYKLYDLKIWF